MKKLSLWTLAICMAVAGVTGCSTKPSAVSTSTAESDKTLSNSSESKDQMLSAMKIP